jgi:hypothetical protein
MLGFRITGPQSVERLTPLLPLVDPAVSWEAKSDLAELLKRPSGEVLAFVWETFVERTFKPYHDSATVLNRLHNTVASTMLFVC